MPDLRVMVAGRARAEIVVLEQPLSFWGGMDPDSGTVIDRRHPQHGVVIANKIVAMPSGRGSSSSSSVLAEAIRAGTAPAGIVMAEVDGIVVLGALVARELYGTSTPVVVAGSDDYARLRSGDLATIDGSSLTVETR